MTQQIFCIVVSVDYEDHVDVATVRTTINKQLADLSGTDNITNCAVRVNKTIQKIIY